MTTPKPPTWTQSSVAKARMIQLLDQWTSQKTWTMLEAGEQVPFYNHD